MYNKKVGWVIMSFDGVTARRSGCGSMSWVLGGVGGVGMDALRGSIIGVRMIYGAYRAGIWCRVDMR